MKISFSIKTESKKVEPPKPASIFKESSSLANDSDDEFKPIKKLAIRGFQNGEVDGEKESDDEVIIDLCQQKNDWKIQKLKNRLKEEGLSPEEKARILIILESMGSSEEGMNVGEDTTIIEGTNIVEENGEDADYSKVKVKDFGMALLRGCGWKKGEGIGKDKKVVKVVIPKIRPKGLGLGADPKIKKKKVLSDDGKTIEELELKKGSFVKILHGKYTGRYGIVENINVDLVRVFIKLTLGGNKVDVSQFNIEVVSKSEHEKYGKVLNKEKYEKVKYEKEEERGSTKKRKTSCDRERSRKDYESDSEDEGKYKKKRKSCNEECDRKRERRKSHERDYRRSRH
ncbi:G-patch domain and KOW domain-containing protein [Strongyloides ratti]|uniref:G-patch domain and KOW domain-containing protein n=1 Tax=Strongyloides ratti TaxID=34506 RepID=A0A090MRQ5_STRRB|nr:G-patch domain and KOW domain-containing protein [Strongyloides ratti]CEF60928.1 G-patch domain and KOW domain-containing protein [Strongyloides ratti]